MRYYNYAKGHYDIDKFVIIYLTLMARLQECQYTENQYISIPLF